MSKLWKKVRGFPTYSVSTDGDVRNDTRNTILTPWIVNSGYYCVKLCNNGEVHKKYIHRIVAETFIPNFDDKPHVNHINGLKLDNRIENLEWCTSSENHLHRCRVLGEKSSIEHMGKMRDLAAEAHYKAVKCVETDMIYKSGVEAAKAINRNPTSIWQALVGQTDTCGGFHWEYV